MPCCAALRWDQKTAVHPPFADAFRKLCCYICPATFRSYKAHPELGPTLPRCNSLEDLRASLAAWRDAGVLADLAASLARNPLSLRCTPPPTEPFSEARAPAPLARLLIASCCMPMPMLPLPQLTVAVAVAIAVKNFQPPALWCLSVRPEMP